MKVGKRKGNEGRKTNNEGMKTNNESMKKKIKEVQAEVDALKKAQTPQEKDEAIDNMP